MSPITSYKEWHEQQMKDPEFAAEWKKLEPSYQITRLRIEAGITQKKLAELVGTKQSSISRLESGERSPSLSFLSKVAEALGAEVNVTFKPLQTAYVLKEKPDPDSYLEKGSD